MHYIHIFLVYFKDIAIFQDLPYFFRLASIIVNKRKKIFLTDKIVFLYIIYVKFIGTDKLLSC